MKRCTEAKTHLMYCAVFCCILLYCTVLCWVDDHRHRKQKKVEVSNRRYVPRLSSPYTLTSSPPLTLLTTTLTMTLNTTLNTTLTTTALNQLQWIGFTLLTRYITLHSGLASPPPSFDLRTEKVISSLSKIVEGPEQQVRGGRG